MLRRYGKNVFGILVFVHNIYRPTYAVWDPGPVLDICGQWLPITRVSHHFQRENVKLLPHLLSRHHLR